jgi:hypothetical protein
MSGYGRPSRSDVPMIPLPRFLIGWEAVLPAGLWILGSKLMLSTARLVLETHVAPRPVTLLLVRFSGRLSSIGFNVWRTRNGKWR